MADLSEDFRLALQHPRTRDLLLEVMKEALANVLGPQAPASPPGIRLLTSAEMARTVAMSRSGFLELVRRKPEIQRLKVGRRWPEVEVAAAVRAVRSA